MSLEGGGHSHWSHWKLILWIYAVLRTTCCKHVRILIWYMHFLIYLAWIFLKYAVHKMYLLVPFVGLFGLQSVALFPGLPPLRSICAEFVMIILLAKWPIKKAWQVGTLLLPLVYQSWKLQIFKLQTFCSFFFLYFGVNTSTWIQGETGLNLWSDQGCNQM